MKTGIHVDHLYVELARQLEDNIRTGTYQVGEKLPSIRSLHREYGVSMGTALHVYEHLEDKGLIQSRPKTGYFVKRQHKNLLPLPSPPRLIMDEQEVNMDRLLYQQKSQEAGETHYTSFGDAVPSVNVLPLKTIQRALQKVSRDTSGSYLRYDHPAGYLPLRKAIAKRAWTWQGVLHEDELIITNGTLEAINFCLRAITKPGDTVVVSSPCYFGILRCAENLHLKVIKLPNHPVEGIQIEDLIQAIEKFDVKACILISNFNNPDGVTLSIEKKMQLAELAAHYQLPLIEDDIYGDLYFGKERPTTIKTFDKEGWVMLCSSFSKTITPGFRVGWCAAGRFTKMIERLKYMTNIASPLITQMTLAELLHNESYDRHLRHLRVQLHTDNTLMTQKLQNYFPVGTKVSAPAGGYILWVELSPMVDAFDLQKKAGEQKIDIIPGPFFSCRDDFKNFIRLSYGEPWSPRREAALKDLGKLVGSMTDKS